MLTRGGKRRNDARIITCSETSDIWLNEIGPQLHARDLLALARVNRWGHHTAHAINTHKGYARLRDISFCAQAMRDWPNLKLELELTRWQPQPETPALSTRTRTKRRARTLSATPKLPTPAKICVSCLDLLMCDTPHFHFVDPAKLEKFALREPTPNLDESAMASLDKMLSVCTQLKSLTFECCAFEDDNVGWLVRTLAHVPLLTHLDLYGNFLGPEDQCESLCTSLSAMKSLTHLNLEGNDLEAEGMSQLATSLSHTPRMTTLELSDNMIGYEGAKFLATGLTHLTQLTSLELRYNDLEAEGIRYLLPVLTQLPHLTHLDIEHNELSPNALLQVASALPNTQLKLRNQAVFWF
eukprot:c8624_g1_i1.p1 GENE.c8624_g1_i1~~c8624_g1_i1.p1  ORF type:complete len:354 (-),score=72.48 c8624_g1_i1:161-1222(-)